MQLQLQLRRAAVQMAPLLSSQRCCWPACPVSCCCRWRRWLRRRGRRGETAAGSRVWRWLPLYSQCSFRRVPLASLLYHQSPVVQCPHISIQAALVPASCMRLSVVQSGGGGSRVRVQEARAWVVSCDHADHRCGLYVQHACKRARLGNDGSWQRSGEQPRCILLPGAPRRHAWCTGARDCCWQTAAAANRLHTAASLVPTPAAARPARGCSAVHLPAPSIEGSPAAVGRVPPPAPAGRRPLAAVAGRRVRPQAAPNS